MGARYKYTEEQITTGLMALVAWAGNTKNASRYLKAQKDLTIPASTLGEWKHLHALRYNALREEYRDQLEGNLANELLEVGRLAVEGERLAIEKATGRLEKNEDLDPGRTAANLARVTQSSVDKNRTLTDREPRQVETRGIEEILRSLGAMGVFKGLLPPEGVEVDTGDVAGVGE